MMEKSVSTANQFSTSTNVSWRMSPSFYLVCGKEKKTNSYFRFSQAFLLRLLESIWIAHAQTYTWMHVCRSVCLSLNKFTSILAFRTIWQQHETQIDIFLLYTRVLQSKRKLGKRSGLWVQLDAVTTFSDSHTVKTFKLSTQLRELQKWKRLIETPLSLEDN